MKHEEELERGIGEVHSMQTKDRSFLTREELEPLSQFLAELNTQFGTDFNENDTMCILAIEERLSKHASLKESLRGKKAEDALLTFSQAVTEILQSMFETSSKLYKQMTEDRAWASQFARWSFERYQWQEK